MAFIGTGTTVTFGTSNFAANITDINFGEVSREHKDTTYLGTTTAKTFIPTTLYDAGEMKLSIQFAANRGGTIPISSAAETVTIAWPGGASVAGSAFVTGYEVKTATEAIVTADVKVKFSSSLVWAGQS